MSTKSPVIDGKQAGKTAGKTKQPAPPAKSAPAAAPQKTAQVTPKQTSAPTPAPKKPAEKKPEVKLDVDAAFTALDKEGVGYLVLEKVRPALRRKGYTTRFIEHLFCHLGPDLKGRVTQAQFQDALKCLPKGIFGLNEAMSDDELLEVYQEADMSNSESLTVSQLGKFFSERGVSAKFLMDYLFLIDILGDEVVTLDNYKRTLGIPGAREEDAATKFARQIERMKDLFDECDLDESGELCLEEIRIVLKQKGYSDHFVERFYCHLDINKDGAVKRDEFYEALKIIPKEIFLSDHPLSDKELLALFDDLDTDHSGVLSWVEFKEGLAKKGFGSEFIKTYFEQMDLGEEQEITREQFARCLGLQLPQAAANGTAQK